MQRKHNSNLFLFIALFASLVLVFFVAKPFIIPLILAGVFSFLFRPIYNKTLRATKGREVLSALMITILAVVLVLIPLVFFGTQILRESTQLYQSLISGSGGKFMVLAENTLSQIRDILPLPADFRIDLGSLLRQGLGVLVQNFGALFSGFAQILLSTFVFLIAFYFFLKDGKIIKSYFIALSPLEDADDEFIVLRLKSAVSAALKGNLTIGLIQGFLTGIGFWIFGVPNPILWGGVAVVAAFIPGIGTALVVTPAVIYLFIIGSTLSAGGLLVWGLLAVGLVDNFLGPRLIGRGLKMHPLAVFVAVLGGIAFFGPLGFLLGPLVMSVSEALIDIYISIKSRSSKL